MVSIISNVSFSRMARVIWPFLVPLLISLVIVTLVPAISTWLPELMFRK
jgi:TRAP-type C4-dicarboxylate transport system permease large subunit